MKTVGARSQDTCFLISTVTKHLSIQAARAATSRQVLLPRALTVVLLSAGQLQSSALLL